MKGYFNKEDQSRHLIMLSALVIAKELIDGNAISKEEKKLLEKAVKNIDEFSESVFGRLGESYKRSIRNKASLNTLRLVARGTTPTKSSQMEDYIDREYLVELLNLSSDIDCEGCKSTNCKNCNIYKIKSYLNYDGKSEDNDLCPFRKEQADLPQFDFDDLESDSK